MTKVTKKYFYAVHYKDYEDMYEIEVKYPYLDYSIEDVAEEASEDYFHNHDGWESSWPVILYVWNDKGEYLGASDVHVEYSPSFYAYHKEEEKNDQGSD